MVWRLLLTLAVLLGACGSHTQAVTCSTDSECTTEGQACNAANGKCQKICTSNSDCEPVTDKTPCDTCSSTGFCQSCPSDLRCITHNQNKPPPECLCVVASCEKKCGKGNSCCSKDFTTCECCAAGSSTCYEGKEKRDQSQSSSWARGLLLHMEKAVPNGTCQKLCTKDPKACGTENCEKCRTDPNNTAQKLCKPCSNTAHCNNDIGEKACCTGCGCVCCDPWEICKDKSCQCNETACNSVQCGKCDTAGSQICLPNGKCDPGLTCKVDGVGKGTTCECTEASCAALCGGTCDATTGFCTPGDCGDQTCSANSDGSYSCQ